MSPLLFLPGEIVIHIAHILDSQSSINNLAQTCKSLYDLLNLVLYRWNRTHGDSSALHWAAQKGDPQVLRYARDAGTVATDERLPLVHLAVYSSHTQLVTLLLEEFNFSPNNDDWTGHTPLHIAAGMGTLEMVRLLLEHGANIDQQADSGNTPLHEAIYRERKETAQYLIERGASISLATKDELPWTPFHGAIVTNEVELVKIMLCNGADPNNKLPDGEAPIQNAVAYGRLEMARALLDNGVDLHGPAAGLDSEEKLALVTKAVELNHVDIAKLVLERGGSVNPESEIAEATPLALACLLGNKQLASLLLQHGAEPFAFDQAGFSTLHYAARSGNAEIVKMMLKLGLDINGKNNDGLTPLFSAADNRIEVVKALLDNGADAFSMDNNKNTVLHYAAGGSDVSTLRALLEAGANPKLANGCGLTPLISACALGRTEQVKVLLEANVDVNVLDGQGQSSLAAAAGNGHEEVVQILLDHSPDMLQHKDQQIPGNIPLIRAVEGQNTGVVELLMRHGASLDDCNSAGQGPLVVSAKYLNVDIVKLLLESGKVDLDQKDLDGRTALFYASWFGRKEVVDLLLSQDPPPDGAAQDRYSATPLIMAARNGHFAVMLALLGRHGDLTAADVFGHNVFYWAAQHGDDPVVQLFYAFADAVGVEAADVVDNQQEVVPFSEVGCLCDVCGRASTSASSGYPPARECKLCDVGCEDVGFLCCFDCVSNGVTCRDPEHILELHNCQCEEDEA